MGAFLFSIKIFLYLQSKEINQMKKAILLLCITQLFFACKKDEVAHRVSSIPDQTQINQLKINQLQILGSHNSYHIKTEPGILQFLNGISFILPSTLQPADLDYEHEPLDIQLNTYGMRSFEIDIYCDPEGGRFYNRQGNVLINKPVASGIDELNKPGFKVMHIPDIDYNTHFYTFKSMLQALKNWSDAHSNHIPIFILVEGKEQSVGDFLGFLGFKTAVKFTPALCDALDEEVKGVFGANLEKVITPDKVRGNYNTLKEAVLANNWPTVGESRGKFIFVMQGESSDDYLQGHPSLSNRTMFLTTTENKPEAAFLQFNNAARDENKITTAVQNGYIVRTRADEPNKQNKTNDYTEQYAAFRGGAQIISTDYYRPDPRHTTNAQFKDYKCRFPNNELARINPISGITQLSLGKIAE